MKLIIANHFSNVACNTNVDSITDSEIIPNLISKFPPQFAKKFKDKSIIYFKVNINDKDDDITIFCKAYEVLDLQQEV